MKFVPESKEWVYEQLTTANKNIQSYFMKTDQSFYVPDNQKYPEYSSEYDPAQILIDDSCIYFNGKLVDSSIFSNTSFNTEKYTSISVCKDELYKVFYSQKTDAKKSEMFVQLVFNDFMGRSDLIAVIDILLNQIGFKAIMILPLSLSISFAKFTPFCSFLYPNGFSFINDFMLEDSFSIARAPVHMMLDDEDYAEEFSRLKTLDESQRYSCRECDFKEDSEDKIMNHITKEHRNGSFYFYEHSNNYENAFKNRLNYLFPLEKAEKIGESIFSIKTDFQGSELLTDYVELGFKGAEIFRDLDCGKEIWLTDMEWRSARLRILKEKVLFYI